MEIAKIFKELILLIPKIVVTANNQELGSRFHSFTAIPYIDTFMKLLSYHICAFYLDF